MPFHPEYNIHDIWYGGYRLPIDAAIFLGTAFTLICVAALCQVNRW
jgi:hypothetical protein